MGGLAAVFGFLGSVIVTVSIFNLFGTKEATIFLVITSIMLIAALIGLLDDYSWAIS
jgi:UDP-N-acetylmuramyl pentapeptide phosphotransferase/UDP-N-acetylglucosamine-1-phosphate transferase